MSDLRKFVNTFLENPYHLSRYASAAFSAMVVAACLIASHIFGMGFSAPGFVIAGQSVTGINRQGAFRIRLSIAMKTGFILSAAAMLGSWAGDASLVLVLLTGVVLAFSFAYCRQLFPFNWPDIIIPAGVLFFMNYQHPNVALTALGAAIGVVCELLLGMIIYLRRRWNPAQKPFKDEETAVRVQSPDKTIFGLKQYLAVYGIELSLLLAAGFVLMHTTDYPHAYWMPLTAIIVLKVGRRATFMRVVERTLGTLAGCVLGSFLLYLNPGTILMSVAMVACIFVWLCYLRHNYAVGTIFITTFIFILLNGNAELSIYVIGERIVFTILGGAMALLSSIIFLRRGRLHS